MFKKKEKIILSSLVSYMLLATSILSADIIVDNENTTGVATNESTNVTVTENGSIKILNSDDNITAIYFPTSGLSVEHSIVNDGNITLRTSADYSFGILVGDDNNGTIKNNALIDINSSSYGEAIRVYGDNRGEVINNGTIISNRQEGINLFRADRNVTNEGNITNSGTITSKYNSISILGTNNGTITNSGSLTSSDSQGIYISQDNNGNIINSGTISSKYDSLDIFGTNNGTITNSGTITSSDGNGIYILQHNNGDIVNSGTITSKYASIFISGTNNGTITNSDSLISSDGQGIFIAQDNNGTITNSGSIESKTSGIKIYENNNGSVINLGTINTLNDTNNAISINVSTNNGLIENNGTINANIGVFINDENVGIIKNNGTINATDYALAVNFNNAGGTFINNGISNGSIYAKGVDVYNNGNMTLKYNQNIQSKSYTQSKDGTLNVGMYIAENTTVANTSTIITDQNIIFADNSKINVNTTNTSRKAVCSWFDTLQSSTTTDGYKDFNNEEGLIAKSESGIIDVNTSKLNIIDNSSLFNYTVEKDGDNKLNLLVKKVENALSNIVSSVGSGSAKGSAEALDRICMAGHMNEDIDEFLTNLDELGTDEEKAEALVSAAPTSTLSSASAVLQLLNTVDEIVQSRQSSARGMSSGDILLKDKNIWIEPFGNFANQDNENTMKGFDADSRGVAIGFDAEFYESKRIGLSFFLTDTSVNTNDVSQENNIDSYTMVVYGSMPVVDSSTMFYYQIGGGIQKNDSSRYILASNETATSKYTSKTYMANTKIEKSFYFSNGLSLLPTMELSYRHFSNPDYDESGAGGMSLKVNNFSDDEILFGLGSNVNYKLSSKTNFYGGVMAHYNFDNKIDSVSSSFQGASDVVFDTKGIDNSAMTYSASTGVSQVLKNGFSLNVNYALNAKTSGFINHKISAKLNWKIQ